jgi:hypothetical protein
MDVENESLSSRLDRIENSIRAQKEELDKAKHYMPSMRQELANDYIDGFEVQSFQLQAFCDSFETLNKIVFPPLQEIYKTMNVMIELITNVILDKELHRFGVFENYMETLTTSLTLKLRYESSDKH